MERPKKISDTQLRALFIHSSTESYTERQLQNNLDLSVLVRLLQQLLSSINSMVHIEMKSVPMLTEDHKNQYINIYLGGRKRDLASL